MSKSILYCKCINTEYISLKTKNIFESILNSRHNNLFIVDDLCGLIIAEKKSQLIDFMTENNDMSVVACHPRAVKWLLSTLDLPENIIESFNYFNIYKIPMIDILESLSYDLTDNEKNKLSKFQDRVHEKTIDDSDIERNLDIHSSENSGRPWFPVLDYKRCRQCGACMDFCLFGVYEKNEQERIVVRNPDNCKDNCPACARVCPHSAIIFPKYDKPPINGDLTEEEASGKHRKPIFSLSGDELYKALSKRNVNNKKLYK